MGPIAESILIILVSFLNFLDKSLQIFGFKLLRMDKQSMLKRLKPELQEETKSKDIALPFDLFLKGLANDDMMDFWRRVETNAQLKSILQNRVDIKKALQMNSNILQVPIKKPMFILGLPRSGTTHLFNLLSQAEDVTAPLMWQMYYPAPPGKPQNWRNDPRFKKLDRALNIFRVLGHKHSDVAHETRADGPEECAVILRYCSLMMGQHILRLPSLEEYAAWYYSRTAEDFEEMYKNYKKVLQMMVYGEDMSNKRYLLKCIWHCLGVEALHKTFPDACIIYNYRSLDAVVPSACSMAFRTTYAWGPPDDKYGQRIVQALKQYTDRVVSYLKKFDSKPQKESPIFVCNYQSLVTDPIGTVKNIYDHFDLDFTKPSEDNMKQYLKANPPNKHGKHQYSLQEYNLDMNAVNEEFEEYIKYMSNKISS